MTCTHNCNQGRACDCRLVTCEGGESVDTEDDFLRQDSVLRWTIPALALWAAVAVALALITAGIAFAVGYVGRLLGVI